MSTVTSHSSLPEPDLRTVLLAFRKEIFAELNCLQIGTIQTFDAIFQTATVTINSKRQFGDEVKDYPLLVDVPIVVMGGGKGRITYPIAKGDTCLVWFNDRNIDSWWGTGGTGSIPNSPRLHSMADGIALVGIRAKTNPIAGYSTTDVQVLHDDGGVISVAAKIQIANNSTSLLTVLQDLIGDLTSARTTANNPFNSATIANLNTTLAKVNALLK
jgi:hypothetical protein